MGISFWQIGIVLLIVILLFGTKKLRNVGGDLGSALKGFKNAMKDDEDKKDADFQAVEEKKDQDASTQTVQNKASSEPEKQSTSSSEKATTKD